MLECYFPLFWSVYQQILMIFFVHFLCTDPEHRYQPGVGFGTFPFRLKDVFYVRNVCCVDFKEHKSQSGTDTVQNCDSGKFLPS